MNIGEQDPTRIVPFIFSRFSILFSSSCFINTNIYERCLFLVYSLEITNDPCPNWSFG